MDARTRLSDYSHINRLTPREKQVCALLVQRFTYREISQRLVPPVSSGCVARHANAVYQKLDVHGRLELITLMERAVVVGLEILGECMCDKR